MTVEQTWNWNRSSSLIPPAPLGICLAPVLAVSRLIDGRKVEPDQRAAASYLCRSSRGMGELSEVERGIEQLYARHMPDAVRLAYLLTDDGARAEDVAQDAFLKSAAKLHQLRDADRFGAYLRSAVVRTSISANRSENRQALRAERAARLEPSMSMTSDSTLDSQYLLELLKRLPHRQRAVVVLRFWLDMSEQEIADTLGCAQGTVKSSMSRALESLRGKVGPNA